MALNAVTVSFQKKLVFRPQDKRDGSVDLYFGPEAPKLEKPLQ